MALVASAGAVPLAAVPVQAQVQPAPASSSPLGNPKGNIARTAAMNSACRNGPTPGCQTAVVQGIDQARTAEGVKALVLPSYYNSLGQAEQLLVLADLERTDRGLPGFAGLSSQLDTLAQAGANTSTDPNGPSDADWGSNWAGGEENALLADYDWMYDDGPGSPNMDCTPTDTSGCWSHRENVLASYGAHPSMGAAAAEIKGVTSMTELFASTPAGALDYRLPSVSGASTANVNNVAPVPARMAPNLTPLVTPRNVQIQTNLGLPQLALVTVSEPDHAFSATATVAGNGGRWTVTSECSAPKGADCDLMVRFLGLVPGVARATITVHLPHQSQRVEVSCFVKHAFWFARPISFSHLTDI